MNFAALLIVHRRVLAARRPLLTGANYITMTFIIASYFTSVSRLLYSENISRFTIRVYVHRSWIHPVSVNANASLLSLLVITYPYPVLQLQLRLWLGILATLPSPKQLSGSRTCRSIGAFLRDLQVPTVQIHTTLHTSHYIRIYSNKCPHIACCAHHVGAHIPTYARTHSTTRTYRTRQTTPAPTKPTKPHRPGQKTLPPSNPPPRRLEPHGHWTRSTQSSS